MNASSPPDQLRGSGASTSPSAPAHLYMEDISTIIQSPGTIFDSGFQSPGPSQMYDWFPLQDRHIISAANDRINQDLERTPSGGSIVEPDSVIGESGRLYHGYKEGKYFMPNDAAEQDRLDLQHEIYRLVLGGWLNLAPLHTAPKYVLDIGTGTAEQNPSSYVIGTDLSAIQPIPRVVNCHFVKADMEDDDWIFPDPAPDHSNCSVQTGLHEHMIAFDYIHLRLMLTCFNNPKSVISNILKSLRPGGWVEFQEARFGMHQANPEYPASIGRDVDAARFYPDWLKEAGFVDVVGRHFIWPIGPWHADPRLKLIGEYARINCLEGVRPIGYKMLRLAGYSAQEVEDLVQQTKLEQLDKENHTYILAQVETALRPLLTCAYI
ncbi:S-adenosyl-L-methionine-dependent methyltransferase [Xylariales sp. PMI_506]|nr:S-adenosyl-L-methionine-dependent methyltransferase [Xylariales sp. PMI_506]